MNRQSPEARATFCKALREFVDLVETNTSIPVPTNVDVWVHLQRYSTGLSEPERLSMVYDLAEALNTPVTVNRANQRHTEKKFGEIKLYAYAYPDETAPRSSRRAERVITRDQDTAAAHDQADEALDERMALTGRDQGELSSGRNADGDGE